MSFNYTNKDYARIHDKGTIFNKFLTEATQLAEQIERNQDKKIKTPNALQSAIDNLTRKVDHSLNPREYYWFQRAVYWTGLRDVQNPAVGMRPRYIAGILFDDQLYRHCAILFEFLLFDLGENLFGGPHNLQGKLDYKDARLNILLQDRLFALEEFVLQIIVDSQSTIITYPGYEDALEAQQYLIGWYKERRKEVIDRRSQHGLPPRQYGGLKDIPEPNIPVIKGKEPLPQWLVDSLKPSPPKLKPETPTPPSAPIKMTNDSSFGNMDIKKGAPTIPTTISQSVPALLSRLANEVIALKQEVARTKDSISDAQTGQVELLLEVRELLLNLSGSQPRIPTEAVEEQGSLEDELLGIHGDIIGTALHHVSQWPDLASGELSAIEPNGELLGHGIWS